MNEFDEICAVRRIVELYRERGTEVTQTDVKKYANQICRTSNLSVGQAYEAIEDDLLSKKPPRLPPWPNGSGV